MSLIVATDVAVPALRVTQAEVAQRIADWLRSNGTDPRRVLDILAGAGVAQRFSVSPLDDVFMPRSLAERNATYAEAATSLAEEASRAVLARVGLPPTEIGLVTSVSCTGFLIPSIDAHLANRLPFGPHVRRMPLTLLGCAGGAMGLSHAVDHLVAHPEQHALVVAVELPSQSFQVSDFSMAHLVSCALFGDGAAATLVAGDDSPVAHAAAAGTVRPRVVATRTRFFHDTLDTMGFLVRDTGFHMVLDSGIPRFVDETIWPEVVTFLADNGLDPDAIDHVLVHPGGRRILDAVEARLGRGREALLPSRTVLRDFGNLSSASVLVLLREHARRGVARAGDRGLILAFGPGFNAEMLLLEWVPCGP